MKHLNVIMMVGFCLVVQGTANGSTEMKLNRPSFQMMEAKFNQLQSPPKWEYFFEYPSAQPKACANISNPEIFDGNENQYTSTRFQLRRQHYDKNGPFAGKEKLTLVPAELISVQGGYSDDLALDLESYSRNQVISSEKNFWKINFEGSHPEYYWEYLLKSDDKFTYIKSARHYVEDQSRWEWVKVKKGHSYVWIWEWKQHKTKKSKTVAYEYCENKK